MIFSTSLTLMTYLLDHNYVYGIRWAMVARHLRMFEEAKPSWRCRKALGEGNQRILLLQSCSRMKRSLK